MSVFNPECASNYFQAGPRPVGMHRRQSLPLRLPHQVAGSTFGFDGLDMGDLQAMKGAINKAMTHARRARREWEGAQ